MHHFFVSPEALRPDQVILRGGQAQQIARVLRMRPGDRIVVLDDSGWQHEVELTAVSSNEVVGRVLTRTLAPTEPRTKVVLHQALLRGPKFELVLQKCTELGVAGITPVLSERCVVGGMPPAGEDETGGRFERWTRIIVEAAEQSRRGKLPTLRPVLLFPDACARARGLTLIAWEGEQQCHVRQALRDALDKQSESGDARRRPFTVNLFVGPEGGFSPAEIEVARSYGIVPVTLGKRILRAETAALALVTMVLYEVDDLG